MTSIQPHFEEKRFALRIAIRLPVVVSGRTEDGATWSEPTETDDISTLGALFRLNQNVSLDDTLYIRSHRPTGVPVEVKAQVVRVIPANYGTARIGVAIEAPKESWLRLFVAWIADDSIVDGVSEWHVSLESGAQ
ncbi:MAG TPA: PilZ domain-containing protein [Pyrinomonadaceae bacterium]|nr:PilZ domain-containing protein [Pyrinomonadaceae bacterium]